MPELTIVDFCVFSQRLGASRGVSWRTWRTYSPDSHSWAQFTEAWRAARAAEELAGRYEGLRRPL
jgi:hypothetical protein